MPAPWQYTTIIDLLDHWQSLLAGFLALVAAMIAVVVALRIERRKVDQEIKALRKSLGVELRLLLRRAFAAYQSLKQTAEKNEGPITARMVDSLSRVPAPIIFPTIAHKIGLLEGDAMNVVIVFQLLEVARDGVNRVMQFRTPDDINPKVVLATAKSFLEACKYGRGVLPNVRTGDTSHEGQDAIFIREITEAAGET